MPWFEIFLGFLIIWFIGYFIYYIFTKYQTGCTKDGTTGSTCKQDCDCSSGSCAQNICCPTSQTYTAPNGLKYCAGYADGSKCLYDGMCTSGECVNGQCGESCTGCPSTCGYQDATRASKVCCQSGRVNINGDYYCSDATYGTPCLDNSVCGSGFCKGGNSQTGEIGQCALSGPNPIAPQTCTANSQCKNNVCAYWGDPRQPAVCCPSGNAKLNWWQGDWKWYCTDTPTGTPCVGNDWCASGQCENGRCK